MSVAFSGSLPATLWILVVSNASNKVRGGRIVGRRFANIVLPAPGGPIKIALCPPAAAISNARFIFSCPFTSQKSISKSLCECANSSLVFTMVGLMEFSSIKKSITSLMWPTPYTFNLFTIAASLAFSFGRISPLNFSFLACIAIGNAPFIGLTVPSKLSSPMIT